MNFVKQPLVMVRLRQPLCNRVFGTAPCLATGDKCWNTDITCKYRSALSLTNEIAFDFVLNERHAWIDTPGAYQPALAIPALMAPPRTAATELNVADGNRDSSPLGLRAVVNVALTDFAYNDAATDPYLSTRAYDPMTRGTFWSKWLKRNPFHVGHQIEVYEGYLGDALAAMIKRVYFVERINRTADQVGITAKDPLSRITDSEVSWPPLSPGEMASDIDASAASLTIAGAVLADYAVAPGYLRIGSEIVSYTGISGTANLSVTGVARGVLNTVAEPHKQRDRVQRVVAYENVRCDDILYDIHLNGAGIPSIYLPLATWAAEVNEWRPEFIFTCYLTEPVKCKDLVPEVLTSALLHEWWDERSQVIKVEAQKPIAAPVVLTDESHILKGSYKVSEFPERRASQVEVYFSPRSWITGLADSTNFARAKRYIDVERQIQYGGLAVLKTIFSRWVQTDAIAITLAATYAGRFRDVRREVEFALAEPLVWTGGQISLTHRGTGDFTGLAETGLWLITRAEAIDPAVRWSYVAEDNGMVGVLWEWVDDTIPDWTSASPTQKATIGYWLTDDDLDQDGNPQPFRWL